MDYIASDSMTSDTTWKRFYRYIHCHSPDIPAYDATAYRGVQRWHRRWEKAHGHPLRARGMLWCAAWMFSLQRCDELTTNRSGQILFQLDWPTDETTQRHLLAFCMISAYLPPFAAWEHIAGQTPSRHLRERWPELWMAFRRLCLSDSCLYAHSNVPITCVPGMPHAPRIHGPCVQWDAPTVRAYFRMAQCHTKNASSALEEHWWRCLREAFPSERLVRHVVVPHSQMHVDIYFPAWRIAVEIQGIQHWQAVAHFGGAHGLAARQERDARKRILCDRAGITLIEITHDTPVSQGILRIAQQISAHQRRQTYVDALMRTVPQVRDAPYAPLRAQRRAL